MTEGLVEPWLRGTHLEMEPVRRGVIHALELADIDLHRWSDGLSDEEIHARPFGLPSVAYQLRHIARSLDRLLTYAEGSQLSAEQLAALKTEMDPTDGLIAVLEEFDEALARSKERVLKLGGFDELRGVGRKQLMASVGGLLVHCADHTQRHVGQAITTAKVVMGTRKVG